eukprot:g731.t1
MLFSSRSLQAKVAPASASAAQLRKASYADVVANVFDEGHGVAESDVTLELIEREELLAREHSQAIEERQSESNVSGGGLCIAFFGLLSTAASQAMNAPALYIVGSGVTVAGMLTASTSNLDLDAFWMRRPVVAAVLLVAMCLTAALHPFSFGDKVYFVALLPLLYGTARFESVTKQTTGLPLWTQIGIAHYWLYALADACSWGLTSWTRGTWRRTKVAQRWSDPDGPYADEGWSGGYYVCILTLAIGVCGVARVCLVDRRRGLPAPTLTFWKCQYLVLLSLGLGNIVRALMPPPGGPQTWERAGPRASKSELIVGIIRVAATLFVWRFRGLLYTSFSLYFRLAVRLVPSLQQWLMREEMSWAIDHRLTYNLQARELMLPRIARFGPALQLAKVVVKEGRTSYLHYLITDGTWTLEFGRGEVAGAFVCVHDRVSEYAGIGQQRYDVEASFSNSDFVRARMRQVCGASSYSLSLRNCEHVARYVHCGRWVSLQCLHYGMITKQFMRNRMRLATRRINVCPTNLRVRAPREPLWPGVRPFVCVDDADALTLPAFRDQADAFNVVVVGAERAGKSTIVNQFCNRELRHVNILDTYPLIPQESSAAVGMAASDVIELIRQQVKLNMAHVDRVVLVCTPSLDSSQARMLRGVMLALGFDNYPLRFTFVCNKCDDDVDDCGARDGNNVPSASSAGNRDTRQAAVARMIELLRTGDLGVSAVPQHSEQAAGVEPLLPVFQRLNISLASAPRLEQGAREFDRDRADFAALLNAVFLPLSSAECAPIVPRDDQLVRDLMDIDTKSQKTLQAAE